MNRIGNCEYCGLEFVDPTKSQTKRFCSSKCYHSNDNAFRKLRRANKNAESVRICVFCGISYTPRLGQQRYCSPSCVEKVKQNYNLRAAKARIRAKIRVKSNKQIVLEHRLAHPCPCGESDPVCLDFHHRPGEIKKFGISRVKNKKLGQEALLAEIAKCDILCANCHRKHHARERLEIKLDTNSETV